MGRHLLTAFLFVTVLYTGLLCSCAEDNAIQIRDAVAETMCRLATFSEDEELGRLNSMAVVDSAHFVLSTDSQVYLYDMSGTCVLKIGRSGNARFEYNLPLHVRSDGKFIYVWSAMTLKFIAYTLDGKPVGEYGYSSALRDFYPCGNSIVIYTAGRQDEHVIDIYDKVKCSVVKSLGNSSDAHKVLLGWMSPAPVCICDNVIYYASQDKLEVLEYNQETDDLGIVAEIESDTFRPIPVKGNLSGSDARAYRCVNPNTLMLLNHNNGLLLLASEGRYEDLSGQVLNDAGRYCSLYHLERNGGKKVASFSMSSLGYLYLMSAYHGNIYFIRHSISDNDDVYTLNRLKLN